MKSAPVTDAAPKRIQLSYTPNNVESFERLKDRWVEVLKRAGHATTSLPLARVLQEAHSASKAWAIRMARAAWAPIQRRSVLDTHCKAHDLDNLYVVDASFFVSASAVNPSLTIIANAMRVAEHLLAERLK